MMRKLFILALSSLFLFPACASDTGVGSGDLITIAGVVRDVDTFQPAVGVRVRLLDRNYMDEVATGTDGAYELNVPRNARIYLVTGDFDMSTDNWYPMINVDYPALIATDDILDLPIHACPQTIGRDEGSLAVLDNYLKNQDDSNGDIFAAHSLAECSGAVFVSIWQCVGGTLLLDGYNFGVATNQAAFPIAYPNQCVLHNGWKLECNPVMHPPSRTVADELMGQAMSFGAPGVKATEVAFTVEDTLSTRNLAWMRDVPVPVRAGKITFVNPCAIDGVANKSFAEFAKACTLFGS